MTDDSPKPGWHVDRTTYDDQPDIYWVSKQGTRFELWEIEDRVRVNPLSSGVSGLGTTWPTPWRGGAS
jgi:hypothetical protein